MILSLEMWNTMCSRNSGFGGMEDPWLQSPGRTSISSRVHWLRLDHNKEPEHNILPPSGRSSCVLQSKYYEGSQWRPIGAHVLLVI